MYEQTIGTLKDGRLIEGGRLIQGRYIQVRLYNIWGTISAPVAQHIIKLCTHFVAQTLLNKCLSVWKRVGTGVIEGGKCIINFLGYEIFPNFILARMINF